MKRNTSSSYHDKRFRQLRNEDNEIGLRSRTKEERLQHKREEWMIQQEREREYEKLKKKRILEYELRRAREKKLSKRSKTKSRSPENRDTSNTSKTFILSEKLESSDGISLFKGPEGTQINATELRKIKVDIHRVLPGKPTTTTDKLKRDIINPEDVMLKRRTGEGSKPIFEREEIKDVLKTNEITKHHTVLVVNIEGSENEIICKNHATSSNSLRSRSRSFQHTSSSYSSLASQEIQEITGLNKNICHLLCQHYLPLQKKNAGISRERSCSKNREYNKKKDRQYEKLYNEKKKLLQEKTSRKRYSRSREREQKSHKNENSYREYREISRERSRDRRERERERKIISSLSNNYNYKNYNNNYNNYNKHYNNKHYNNKQYYNINYIEQIPVPVYYGNFPSEPITVKPWVSMQEQVPRFRYIGSLTPLPRFIPPNMYRPCPPLNRRFGPMY
uniref:Complementary sex determiner n=1 Tax=Apis dorsata TaxID=7462 RepID=B1NW76_APIDO|nr:complementary sex determiner [Apis dorsata]